MRKFVPYIVTAVLAASVAFVVSYVVSHSKVRVGTSDDARSEWTTRKMAGSFFENMRKENCGARMPPLVWLGLPGPENTPVKLTLA